MNKKSKDIGLLKIKEPCRNQVEFQMQSLEQLLPYDHKARDVWSFVDDMDTAPIFTEIKSLQGGSGRPVTSPKVLLAVWIYSILDGNTSARKLEDLCHYHLAYKWLVGGTAVNRTMLANFRSIDPLKFEDLLTSCLAAMVQTGLIDDRDFSQDGSRIKANAGFSSFRREASLKKTKEEIQNYLQNLGSKADYDKRKKQELIKKQERVNAALKALEEARTERIKNGTRNRQAPKEEDLKKIRTSITDPSCRKMKMGDGGYRLAYNVQFATGLDSRVIFGVDVVNTLDPGTASRMMAKVNNRLHRLNLSPAKNWLTDSAYSSKEDITEVAALFPNCCYISPAKVRKGCDPKKYQKTDSEAVKNWRDNLENPQNIELYKKRCSTAEFSNAQVKNDGLTKFSVRGFLKVRGQVLLHAIANNIERFLDLKKKSRLSGMPI